MAETVRDHYRRLLSAEEADELEGLRDDMSSSAPSSVKEKANARIKVLIAKAEAEALRRSEAPFTGLSLSNEDRA